MAARRSRAGVAQVDPCGWPGLPTSIWTLRGRRNLLFFGAIENGGADALLLTGDIAGAASIERYLNLVHERTGRPIWLVLGNYYGGSIAEVRERMAILSRRGRSVWLGAVDVVSLSSHTALVGHDGWGDARVGRHFASKL